MDSAETDTKTRKEREDTDASLLAERHRTDSELAKAVTSLEEDADQVLELARQRAESILDTARELADRDMAAAGVVGRVRRAVEIERGAQDQTIAEERVLADKRLQLERDEQQRALTALLRLEREATNDGLLVERAHADKALATRDDFLAMASHDLRTMLGGIALSAQALAKPTGSNGDADVRSLKHAERIQRFVARMNRLVGDLLDVVSLESGTLHIAPKLVDACQLLKEAEEGFRPAFIAEGITLTTDVGPGPIVIDCDHDRIIQVLTNLVSNALKFTDKGGQVAMSLSRTESEVHFSVTDNGVGIPTDQQTVIFERFRRIDTEHGRGLGLGLYIAKSVIDVHGGRIWVESRTGGGSAFHFTLPVAPPTAT
jgi:signal transduction histidine kinase